MVRQYVDAVEDIGATEDTVFVVIADHGDMNMEHQGYYKMSPYDASASVPFLAWGPGIQAQTISEPVSTLDLFKTFADIASVPDSELPPVVEGKSLLPILKGE